MSAVPRRLEVDAVPAALRAQPRWAVWCAVWNAKRGGVGKFDKVPHNALPPHPRVSTTALARWQPFGVALQALQADAGERFAGLGYVMTRPHGIVGVDLDGCVDEHGVLAPWAEEVARQLDSYAEMSPSGRGVRIFCLAEIEADWTNHEQGIEVYAGHEARFLTVTGRRLPGAPPDLCAPPEGALQQLAERFARERSAPQAALITLELPDLPEASPATDDLELPYAARDLLDEGITKGDRSEALFATAVALHRAGLAREQVFAVLAHNEHAMAVALDHRRQDHDRALRYLWVEHAQKAAARAAPAVASADDFDVVGDTAPSAAPTTPAEAKPPRFVFEQAAAFSRRKPAPFLIKGVLPQADVGAIFGPSGAGKSFFALDVCMAVARGVAWQGRRTRAGTVAYVCAEGAGGFTLRLRAYAGFHGVELEGLNLYVLGDQPNLLQLQDTRDLVAALKALPDLVLVVLDTLAQVTIGANENSAEDMGRALGHCRALRSATGAMVLLVAHAGKDAERGLRGWSGIKGALDVEICVERGAGPDAHRRWATVTKMKDGAGEGDTFYFALNSQALGEDDEGEPIASCVLQFVGAPAPGQRDERRALPKGDLERLVLTTARDLLDLTSSSAISADGGSDGADGVTVHQLWDAVAALLPAPEPGKRDRRRNLVQQAWDRLREKGYLAVDNGFIREQEAPPEN